ncbi:hypothetical protein PybrP1_007122 [[Pythium] brassicae (nom. inval.)]|nr:hypothetical protein PybrP1_007122 [[Pythium] brassicae (nom. inval.)]
MRNGAPPQFSIALILSLTVASQFRFLSLRQTPIADIQAAETLPRLHPIVQSLLCANGGRRQKTLKPVFWRSYSVTPLSAGVLWPPASLAVSWSDDLFHFHKADSQQAPKQPPELVTLDDRSEHVYLVPVQHVSGRSGLDWGLFVLKRALMS